MSTIHPEPERNAPTQEAALKSDIYWQPWTLKHVDTAVGEQFHFLPDNDKHFHLNSEACACEPVHEGTRLTKGGIELPFFVHQSWDLRELDEWWYFNIQHPELGKTDKDYE